MEVEASLGLNLPEKGLNPHFYNFYSNNIFESKMIINVCLCILEKTLKLTFFYDYFHYLPEYLTTFPVKLISSLTAVYPTATQSYIGTLIVWFNQTLNRVICFLVHFNIKTRIFADGEVGSLENCLGGTFDYRKLCWVNFLTLIMYKKI